MTEHSHDGRLLETVLVIADFQRHFRPAEDVRPERKIGLAAHDKFPLFPPATLPAQPGIPRLLPKIDDAAEQRFSSRQVAPALDFHERRVFVSAHGQALCAPFFEPIERTHFRADAHPHWQRVGKKADDRFRPDDGALATRTNNAKHHVLFAAVATQQNRPCPLQKSLDRQPVLPGDRTESVRLGGGENHLLERLARVVRRRFARDARAGEWRGRGEAF